MLQTGNIRTVKASGHQTEQLRTLAGRQQVDPHVPGVSCSMLECY